MAHARTQIRAAVVAELASTTYPVVPGRVYPDGGPLPALSVYTDTEATEPDGDDVMGNNAQVRRLVLTVEGRDKDVIGIDDALDAICLEVERALGADQTLGGLAQWVEIRGTQYERTDSQEQPLGVATMAYEIEYRVDRVDPEIIVP